MIRRFHRKDSCTGKYRYSAHEADLEIERAATFRGEQLRAYECEKCGSLHLTALSKEEFEKFGRKQ
jgi:hypothetical protein